MIPRFPYATKLEPFALKLVSHLPKTEFPHSDKGAMNTHLAGSSWGLERLLVGTPSETTIVMTVTSAIPATPHPAIYPSQPHLSSVSAASGFPGAGLSTGPSALFSGSWCGVAHSGSDAPGTRYPWQPRLGPYLGRMTRWMCIFWTHPPALPTLRSLIVFSGWVLLPLGRWFCHCSHFPCIYSLKLHDQVGTLAGKYTYYHLTDGELEAQRKMASLPCRMVSSTSQRGKPMEKQSQ